MEGTGEGVGGASGWPLAPGTSLGKYRIVRFLGEGGMGAVYEGLHAEIGKRVAIKTISPALAAIPEARARFLLEAQLTSRIRHPHTVDVTDICMDVGVFRWFYAMKLHGNDVGGNVSAGLAARLVALGVWGRAVLLVVLFVLFLRLPELRTTPAAESS